MCIARLCDVVRHSEAGTFQGCGRASGRCRARSVSDRWSPEQVEVDLGLAWVRDLFERIDVDSRDEKAVAVWKATADERVGRSNSVYEWLRR